MTDMSEILGRAIRKGYEIDSDIGKIGDELILPGGFNERINVHVNGVKKNKVFPEFKNSFILGHSKAGILGANPLQLVSNKELYMVYNGENTYYETLASNDFINIDSSTAIITLNDKIELDNGTKLFSNQIFKSPTDVCTSVILDMSSSDFNLDNSTISFRTSETGSWEEYTEGFGYPHYFNSLGSELYYKIESNDDNQYINLDGSMTLFKINYTTQNQKFIYDDAVEGYIFYDDSLSNNSTWDITNNKIILGAGSDTGTVYTKKLTSGNAYNYATLEIGDSIGSYDVFISADNKNSWQVLPESTKTTLLSSTDEGIYLRIDGTPVENGTVLSSDTIQASGDGTTSYSSANTLMAYDFTPNKDLKLTKLDIEAACSGVDYITIEYPIGTVIGSVPVTGTEGVLSTSLLLNNNNTYRFKLNSNTSGISSPYNLVYVGDSPIVTAYGSYQGEALRRSGVVSGYLIRGINTLYFEGDEIIYLYPTISNLYNTASPLFGNNDLSFPINFNVTEYEIIKPAIHLLLEK